MSQPWTQAVHRAPTAPALRTAVLVAHPNDEILGLGGQLAQMRSLILVHVTDGAPRDPIDVRRAGFTSREGYAQARASELDRALAAAGVRHASSRELGIAELEATQHLAELVKLLLGELAQADIVVTHPYEGGHPDHDACALAAQATCTLLSLMGAVAPLRLEFAGYHAREGRLCAGRFWDTPGCPERAITLDDTQRTAKRAALAQLVTPSLHPGSYPAEVERLRRAPTYDFTRPPPPQELLYEHPGARMSGSLWRAQASAALRSLGLD
jgi:LmbE family N-acetylglucosaminyl deacetylase